MPRFSDLKTDDERLAFVKDKLEKDDRWIARGILTLFSMQTPNEKRGRKTIKANGKGFNSHDAEILTRVARELLHGGGDHAAHSLQQPFALSNYMSEPLEQAARRKMPKYAAQLLEFAAKRPYPA